MVTNWKCDNKAKWKWKNQNNYKFFSRKSWPSSFDFKHYSSSMHTEYCIQGYSLPSTLAKSFASSESNLHVRNCVLGEIICDIKICPVLITTANNEGESKYIQYLGSCKNNVWNFIIMFTQINLLIFLFSRYWFCKIILHKQLQKGAPKSFQFNVYIRTIIINVKQNLLSWL